MVQLWPSPPVLLKSCVRARVTTRGDDINIAGDAVMHGFGQADDADKRWEMGVKKVVRLNRSFGPDH